MCSLVSLRALNKGVKFSMASNVRGFGKFDDIVVQIEGGHVSCMFLQLKHKKRDTTLSPKEKKPFVVKQMNFLSPKHDFSLLQYHQSYLEVRARGGVDLGNCVFIIYTNADVEDRLKNREPPTIDVEGLVLTDRHGLLKFNMTEHPDIYKGLKDLDHHQEFLDQLRVMYRQATEEQLDILMKQELQEMTQDVEHLHKLHYSQMQDWWLRNSLLTEQLNDDHPLQRAMTEMKTNMLGLRKAEVATAGIRFQDHALQRLRQSVGPHRVVVVSCEGRSTTVTAAKIHQLLTSDKAAFMLVNTADLDAHRRAILWSWQQAKFAVLVVECRNTATYDLDIYHDIAKLLSGAQERRLVVISVERPDKRETQHIRSVFGHDLTEVVDRVRLDDLTDATRTTLTDRNIAFQGAECPLSTVVSPSQTKYLGSDAISALLGNEQLEIGGKLQQTVSYYIDRTLQRSDSVARSTKWRPTSALDGEDRLIVVTAEPGMGKSSLVTRLAQQTKQHRPGTWVVRVNLNAHTKMLDNTTLLTEELAVQLLADAAGVDKASVQGELLADSLQSAGNMVVMLDGVDEVSPTYYHQVEQVVRFLRSTKVDKIWLTARPHMKAQLERSFGRAALSSLVPFTTQDQQTFLLKFWTDKISGLEEEVLARFAQRVVELSCKWLGDREKQFMGIPLQSLLLAEVFEEKLRRRNTLTTIELPHKIDLLYLYSEFVEKKWNIYTVEKKLLDTTNVGVKEDNIVLHDKFIQDHMTAALVTILTDDELTSLDNQTYLLKFRRDARMENTGIITDTVGDKPQFLHRTLAEYFVALWFCQHHGANRQFLLDHLLDERLAVVRLVMDYKLTEDCPLHRAVLDNDIGQIHDRELTALDKGGRTALHLAVCYQLPDIVKVLLTNNCDVDVEDKVLGWGALQYARKINNWEVLVELLGGREQLREAVWPTCSDIRQYGHINECLSATIRRGLVHLLNYLLGRGIDKDFVLSGIDKLSLLHLAVQHNQIEVVGRLLESSVKVEALDQRGRTALHLSAQTGNTEMTGLIIGSSKGAKFLNLQEKKG